MCGRYVVSKSGADLADFFSVDETGEDLAEPSYNVAPTDPINVLLRGRSRQDPVPAESAAASEDARIRSGTVLRLERARWGLVPPWTKTLKGNAPLFNARVEEAASKPSFRNAVKKRRAAIPASGYYEWKTSAEGVKQPYFLSTGDEPFVFAGMFEWWKDPALAGGDPASWVLSATILTQAATGRLAEIHPRTPVLLAPELFSDWLDPEVAGSEALLDAVSAEGTRLASGLALRPVSGAVGSVRNNHAGLIAPLNPQ